MTVLERNDGDFTPGGRWAQATHAGLLSQTPSSQQIISASDFRRKLHISSKILNMDIIQAFFFVQIVLASWDRAFYILSTFLFLAVFEGYSCL